MNKKMKEESSIDGGPGDGLEDLLIYDDLFLDYFNAFLALPAFPQTLQYHRLTGTFQGSEDTDNSLVECVSPLYGATDDERERIMVWASEERLPLFLRTELFRELKLCKLLLRALEDRSLASRSTHVRGYSRQTEEEASSLSNSADNSEAEDDSEDEDDDDDDDDDDGDSYPTEGRIQDGDMDEHDSIEYDKFYRPGSRALSLPAKVGLFSSGRRTGASRKGRGSRRAGAAVGTRSHKQSSKTDENERHDATYTSSHSSDKKSVKTRNSVNFSVKEDFTASRAYSAPLNYADFLHLPMYSEFDMEYGYADDGDRRPLVAFAAEERPMSDADMRSVEGRQNVSFQRLKELLLGSRSGMQEFINFLQPTAGIYLIDFWLDCEYYKDSVEDRADSENTSTRNRLFRDLQDKYRLRLTEEAKRQIRAAANDPAQANSLFLRTQYDVLRRLRSYWVPRFVLHREREVASQTIGDLQNAWLSDMRRCSHASTIFPSLSLVNSMHVYPEQSMTMVARGAEWQTVRQAGRKLDQRVRSAKRRQVQKGDSAASNKDNRTLRTKLTAALAVDKIAGGPFHKFLTDQPEKQLLHGLQFFQEVEEYARRENRSADRLLRLGYAWNICNRYLAPGARFHIGISEKDSSAVINTIRRAKDLVAASAFQPAQEYSAGLLEKAWLRFLKEDVKKFAESSATHRNVDSPPQTAEDFEIVVEGDRLIVKRIELKQLSSHHTRRRSWDLLTDEEKAERRKKNAERRKIMEKERRKAIRAAKQRLKEMENAGKKKEPRPITTGSDDELALTSEPTDLTLGDTDRATTKQGDREDEAPEEAAVDEKPPELKTMLHNKAVMVLFKKYLADKEGKDMVNMLTLYQEVLNYQGLSGSKTQKKDAQANYIYKTFLDKAARRHVHMTSDRVQSRITLDKERPKSVTMKDMASYLLPRLSLSFQKFWAYQSEELGIDMAALKNLSEKELMMRAESNVAAVGAKQKKAKQVTGRAQPTKDDKVEFLMVLEHCANGALTIQMLYFYKYLVKYGQEEGFPNLDKNLFFYVEVQKFKEFAQGRCGEDFLRRKVMCISNTFIESVYPPPLQINISNDVHQRLLRNVQRYANSRDGTALAHFTFFDEAQYICFKELLPYWAGFLRQWEPPSDPTYRPVTRNQKMLEKRLDMFHNMPMPNVDFTLPKVPAQATISALTFTLTEGIKWKVEEVNENQAHNTAAAAAEVHAKRLSAAPGSLPQIPPQSVT